jgi:hypothetical protein
MGNTEYEAGWSVVKKSIGQLGAFAHEITLFGTGALEITW